MQKLWNDSAWEEYEYWQGQDQSNKHKSLDIARVLANKQGLFSLHNITS